MRGVCGHTVLRRPCSRVPWYTSKSRRTQPAMPSRPSSRTIYYTPKSLQPHTQQSITVYRSAEPDAARTPWLIYIHGGAWRDPRQTKWMGYPLIEHVLPAHWYGTSIDYRLSPAVQHPTHVDDVALALRTLDEEYGISRQDIVIVGHSAGACIALQILATMIAEKATVMTIPKDSDNAGGPSGAMMSDAVRCVVCVEGIYDLLELGREYPAYREFLGQAFGEDDQLWDEASPSSLQWRQLRDESSAKIVLIQSLQDQLLSIHQTEEFACVLQEAGWDVEFLKINGGTHDETVESDALYNVVAGICSDVDKVETSNGAM
ncbi:Alpha/Beta hydrolase protein [Limtongia smithiae]|uniref:Alpha/Beta hydrolase protein n=1 Tax=Limtongia smithiae TaxID=1125753 RepID=UPI0034CD4577